MGCLRQKGAGIKRNIRFGAISPVVQPVFLDPPWTSRTYVLANFLPQVLALIVSAYFRRLTLPGWARLWPALEGWLGDVQLGFS